MIAIFLPSAASLYLKLTEIQRELKVDLSRYKSALRWNCGSLVCLFGVTLLLLIVKGAIEGTREFTSAVNGLALVVLLTNLLVLADLTVAMFDVGEASALRRRDETAAKARTRAAEEERHGDAKGSPP